MSFEEKMQNEVSNHSGNRSFEEILEKQVSRRNVLAGGVKTATAGFLASTLAPQAMGWGSHRDKLVGFDALKIADAGNSIPSISDDYDFDVILPWGSPLEPSAPEYNYPPTASEQTRQMGIGHDGMWYFPMPNPGHSRHGWDEYHGHNPWDNGHFSHGFGNNRGVLCMNHEYGLNGHVLGKPAPESLEDVRVSQHAHGISVVEIEKKVKRGRRWWSGSCKWKPVESQLSRRIHVNTPMDFSGPAAGHELLQTPAGNIPLGTLNNCSNGYTPWGTYLTCEENCNYYFGTDNPDFVASETQNRYGYAAFWSFFYGWPYFDKRFDLGDPDYKNEENRFGWVVEIDPMDPTSTPVKRTALGRIKHEGAATHVDENGRVVVYMGDDERFEYIYKFVSEDSWHRMREAGKSPLDHGTLYVARFDDDNSGEWLELSLNNADLAVRFVDMGELLVNTRIAADIVGATPMDRPEWTTVGPDGRVYCTLTNNSRRTEPNAANPLAPNPHGHIIRWEETQGHAGTSFNWDIFLIAEDTHGEGDESTFGSPDGLWADPDGRLFIMTDGSGQPKEINDQLLVADTNTGEVKRLFSGVPGSEVTGLTVTPDRRTMFVNVQHPGNGDPTATNFPVMNETPDGVTVPRDATVVITKKDGGVIGS